MSLPNAIWCTVCDGLRRLRCSMLFGSGWSGAAMCMSHDALPGWVIGGRRMVLRPKFVVITHSF